MDRKLTEKEAWQILARAFSKLGDQTHSGLAAAAGLDPVENNIYQLNNRCVGLCGAIAILQMHGLLEDGVIVTMTQKIDKGIRLVDSSGLTVYLAPTTPEGAKFRVAFCEREIEGLELSPGFEVLPIVDEMVVLYCGIHSRYLDSYRVVPGEVGSTPSPPNKGDSP